MGSARRKPAYLGLHAAPVAPTVHDRVIELRRKLQILVEEAQVIEQQIAEAEMQAVFADYAKTCRVVLCVNGDATMTEAVLDSLTRSTQNTLGMPLTADEWCDALKRYTPADVDDVDGPIRASFTRVNPAIEYASAELMERVLSAAASGLAPNDDSDG